MKKVSFVTPVYNARDMLRRTLESVLRQDYPNIEHVVVDGGSSDGTIDLLKEYEKKYSLAEKELIWVSEKDNGIWDATNKATDMSSGELIMYAADVFANSQVVSEIVRAFEANDIDYLYGGMLYQRDGKIIRRWSGKHGNWRLGWMAASPTLCYTRETWEKHGPYIEDYKASADYDFQIKLFKDKSLKYLTICAPLVIFYAGGISNGNIKLKWNAIKEGNKILHDNNVKFAVFTTLCKIMTALFAYGFASHERVELEDWMK